MTVVKFPGSSEEDLFRCIEFQKRYTEYKDNPSSNGDSQGCVISQKTIYRLKKNLDVSEYKKFESNDNIDVICELEKCLKIKIDIYTQFSTAGKKLILKKNYESSNIKAKIHINIFNSKFNQNQDFFGLSRF